MSLAFDISISKDKTPNTNFHIEITENYEGDKWHVVTYEVIDEELHTSPEHYETLGLETIQEIFNYLRKLQGEIWEI